MRKIKYNIRVNNRENTDVKTEIKKGYLYKTENNFYGIDHRWKYSWYVTELRTGRVVFETERLKDVYDKLTPCIDRQVSEILEKIPETLYVNNVDTYR